MKFASQFQFIVLSTFLICIRGWTTLANFSTKGKRNDVLNVKRDISMGTKTLRRSTILSSYERDEAGERNAEIHSSGNVEDSETVLISRRAAFSKSTSLFFVSAAAASARR